MSALALLTPPVAGIRRWQGAAKPGAGRHGSVWPGMRSIFPPSVAGACTTAAVVDHSPFAAENEIVRTAVLARRAEFLTARRCARLAMDELGVPAVPLLRGSQREPCWPPGIVGSISHTTGWIVAVAARTDELTGLGVDVEQRDRIGAAEAELVCTAEERARIARVGDPATRDLLLVTAFSAKEALFKALFPSHRHYIDFLDVEAIVDLATGVVTLRLQRTVSATLPAGAAFPGRFVADASHVVTGFALARGEAHD